VFIPRANTAPGSTTVISGVLRRSTSGRRGAGGVGADPVGAGAVPAWRNTLSFLYGKFLAANSTPERPVRLLTAVIEKLDPDAPPTLIVAADCLEILTRRGYSLAKPLKNACARCVSGPWRTQRTPRALRGGIGAGRIVDPRFRADAWFLQRMRCWDSSRFRRDCSRWGAIP